MAALRHSACWIALCAAAIGTTACRTRLLVTDITQDTCEPYIDGIPFRVRETHTIWVYQWHRSTTRETKAKDKDGKAVLEEIEPAQFKLVMRKEISFPNQRRLFALNFQSEQFADHDLDLTYFPDNTLRNFSLTGTPNGEGFGPLLKAATGAAAAGLEAEGKATKRAHELLADEATLREKRASRLTDLLTYIEKRDALRQICADWRDWEDGPAKSIVDVTKYKEERGTRVVKARKGLGEVMVAALKIDRTVFGGDPGNLSIEQICELINSAG